MLGYRPSEHYGTFTLSELEYAIEEYARELDLEVTFFQTNHEGEFVERLHRARDAADGLILNPGAWTHYSRAIGDALEVAALPAVEVHISDLAQREDWRQISVIRDRCFTTISGRGREGYRDALLALRDRLTAAGPSGEQA
ncbi:MAG: 3-dehydroquinate dehydratase [Actinobacteria bacterium]|nr:3-dehydroquinate dehydratase [Actinomycetota bacterium]